MKFLTSLRSSAWRAAFCPVLVWMASSAGAGAQDRKAPAPELRFHSAKFYEHGAGGGAGAGAGAASSDRDYAKRFPLSSTRFIATQVVFENLRRGDGGGARDYELTMGLYSFDEQLISGQQKSLKVAADWKFAWATQSYGWAEAGRWSVGTYKLKLWLGDEKVGEETIYVEDDADALPGSAAGITVREVEFYEGGSFFRPGPTERPATSFARGKVRRIYWVLQGVNLLHRVRAQRPNIVGYFYRPDGTLVGETPNRFVVAPEVEDVVLVEGFGWATAGLWEPGRYRFELEQDHRVVAEKEFEVTDPFLKPRERPQVVHYGILDAGVFAAGEAAPPDEIGRKYASTFAAAETDFIWAELVVVNNPNHSEPHTHQIDWQYYQPDGSLLGKTETPLTIQPEWKTARQKASLGWDQGGGWQPGAYKVRIVIDGELVKVVRFQVTG